VSRYFQLHQIGWFARPDEPAAAMSWLSKANKALPEKPRHLTATENWKCAKTLLSFERETDPYTPNG
jgi:hypothetical protein